MNQLLTVNDVAKLLNVSVRTVYEHAERLGGFYPLGIRRLRFQQERIYEHLEGQAKGVLALQLPVHGEGIYGERVRDQKVGRKRQVGSSGFGKVCAAGAAEDRHGLLRGIKTVPGPRRAEVRP